MAPQSFRLETVAALLVQRLEASRLAWAGHPDKATAEIARIAAETARTVAHDCRETLGDEPQARRIEHEIAASFVPRYTRLAIAQNQREGGRFDSLGGRALMLVGGLILALMLERFGLWVWVLPLLSLAWPDLQLAFARRGYRAELQQIVADMAELQEASEKIGEVRVEEPPRVRPRQTETH